MSLKIINCKISAVAAILAPLGLGGCIGPPAGGAETPTGGGATSPTGDRYVFWDGEGTGNSAKGWADCDKKPDCKGTLAPEPGKGAGDSTGLHLHGEGPGWIGGGWNFLGWWPEDGGFDISGYGKLTFSIKVVSESEEMAPDPGAVNVSLRCSKGKKDSGAVALKNYAPDLLNGQWHQVSIPLGEFAKDEFDPGTTWEMNVSTWSQAPKKFDIYLDDIAVEK